MAVLLEELVVEATDGKKRTDVLRILGCLSVGDSLTFSGTGRNSLRPMTNSPNSRLREGQYLEFNEELVFPQSLENC